MPEQHKFNFHLGADPECSFVRNGRAASASQILDIGFNGDIVHKKAGTFGKDGAPDTAELRPSPATSPAEMADNIGALIKSFTDNDFCIDIITESKFKPIGGHIHFELPDDANSNFHAALHSFLSAMYIPLLLGENRKSMVARLKNGYGELSQYKRHDAGRKYTHEFRAPNAEWLTSRKVTEATFAYWFVCYHEFLKDKKRFKKIILANEASQKSMQVIAMEHPGVIAGYAQKIIELVQTFEHYETYKEHIDFIVDAEAVKAHKEKLGFSVRNGWGHALKSIPIRSIAKSNVVATDISEHIMNIVKPLHNGDQNTEYYANLLATIQAKTKRTLRNNYFIYGVRDSISPIVSIEKDIYFGIENASNDETFTKITKMIDKMRSKVKDFVGAATAKETVLIGLPQPMRLAGEYTEFLKIIKACEKGLVEKQEYATPAGKTQQTRNITSEDGASARNVNFTTAPSSGYCNLSEDEILALT